MTSQTIIDRFMAKVSVNAETGCWEWTAARSSNGYGAIWYQGKPSQAHRVSYEIFCGEIPTGEGYHGECVCHSCDNTLCVRPDHLFLSTQAGNMADRSAKGRQARGSSQRNAKLSEEDVIAIRAADARWGINTELARKYGVSNQVISHIRSGKAWAHLGMAKPRSMEARQ